MNSEIAKKFLGHAGFPVFLLALAFMISAPAWRVPLFADDLVHAGKLLKDHPVKELAGIIDSHRFVTTTMTLFDWFRPGLTRRGMEFGVWPWWMAEQAQLSLWRPLTAATHWLDYQLWPSRTVPIHLHNAVWFGLFLMAAWALYRRMDARAWVAGLAALILALNPANWQSLVWVAARNSLVAVFFVVLTLGLYHRFVRSTSGRWAVASWLAFALGLLAGEGAVASAAYLFSYTLFIDERPWKTRLLSMVPFCAVLIAWRMVYQVLGFGTACSGLYVDPGSEPVRFVLNLLKWGPLVLVDVFTRPFMGKYACLAPHLQSWVWGAGLIGVLAVSAVCTPLLRASRAARFWALGLLLTIVPACATTLPDDRVTLYAAIGVAPLVAAFIAGVVENEAWMLKGRSRGLLQMGGILFVVIHLFLPLPGQVKRMMRLFHPVPSVGLLVEPVLRTPVSQELVIVTTPDVMTLSYMPFNLTQDGVAWPKGIRTLSSSPGDTVVRRTGSRTLVLVASHGALIPVRLEADDVPPGAPSRHPFYKSCVIGSAFRSAQLRFKPGDRITLPAMTVEVDCVNGRGLPVEATFTFVESLDSARYHWVFWDSLAGHYAPFTPPRVGEQVCLVGPLVAGRR
ncbi:MAG: hypothetical protein WCS52_10370 [bacterium]